MNDFLHSLGYMALPPGVRASGEEGPFWYSLEAFQWSNTQILKYIWILKEFRQEILTFLKKLNVINYFIFFPFLLRSCQIIELPLSPTVDFGQQFSTFYISRYT